MKKLIIISLLWLICIETAYCANNYSTCKKTTYKKANVYNSQGQRTGYYKVYSSGDEVIKIERYSSKTGRRVERIRYN